MMIVFRNMYIYNYIATGDDNEYRLKQLTTVVAGLASKSEAVIAGTKEQLDSFLSDAWGKYIDGHHKNYQQLYTAIKLY